MELICQLRLTAWSSIIYCHLTSETDNLVAVMVVLHVKLCFWSLLTLRSIQKAKLSPRTWLLFRWVTHKSMYEDLFEEFALDKTVLGWSSQSQAIASTLLGLWYSEVVLSTAILVSETALL